MVTNETVEPLYLQALVADLGGKQVRVISLPDGEAYKNLDFNVPLVVRLEGTNVDQGKALLAESGPLPVERTVRLIGPVAEAPGTNAERT